MAKTVTGLKLEIRSPVRRGAAHRYLLISLVSFAGSVMVTRLFLYLTGYPQVGGGELHIAHVLWGGLLLFIASLVPLILANRWALTTSAILSGVGVGLFIDEVGKFITRSNDYFYPPAAPIIYAFFLITVLVYLRVNRPPADNPRAAFYRVLEGFTEILDHDLDPKEREDMQKQLQNIIQNSRDPNLAQLAQALETYLSGSNLDVAAPHDTLGEKVLENLTRLENRLVSRRRFRLGLVVALSVIGVVALYELASLLPSLAVRAPLLEKVLYGGFLHGEVRSAQGAIWFLVHLVLQGVVGLTAVISGGLLAAGKEKRAVQIASVCLVLSLTVVNLLSFFVDQFSAAVVAMFQLGVLISLAVYRRRYIPRH